MMIKESAIKTFQEKNKQSDVMGVIRTLCTDITINVSPKKQRRNAKQQ